MWSFASWLLYKGGLNPLDKSVLLRSHIRSVANMVPIDFSNLKTNFDLVDVLQLIESLNC